MLRDPRVATVLSLMASACASSFQVGDEAPRFGCGIDSAGWIISEAPENADEYRNLAVKYPIFETQKIPSVEWGRHQRETWLIKSSGEVVLCLADGLPWESWSTSFWRFEAPDEHSGQLKIANKAATIIVG